MMKRTSIHTLVFALPFLLMSACSGGGPGSSSKGGGLIPQAAQSKVPVFVTLHIPGVATQASSRYKKYISAGTASAQLNVTDANGLSTTNTANCTSVCTLSTEIAPGAVRLGVTLFAGTNGTGSQLSSGTLATTITTGSQNAFSMALGGIVASLALQLPATPFTLGTASTTTLSVVPMDASGNVIIGNDAFATPISLALSGTGASEFTLSKTSLNSPADDSVTVSFNGGSIAASPHIGASIGSSAITATTNITTHSPIVLPSMAVTRASTFVNSIGVNTHFNYPIYSSSFATVKSLLVASGIRHIRDGFVSNPASAYVYFGYLQQLQSSGIHATMETSMNMSASTILANVTAVPNFTEAIEAPNEYDLSGDGNWATNLTNYQQTLYSGVKATAGISSLPVIGPALTSPAAYGQVGNLSAYMDQGNMHDYFSGYNPGTGGYGGGGFGSVYGTIAYNLGAAAQTSGSKPVVATETGYCTIPNTRNAISPAMGSKYMPRMFLEQWLAGVQRTIDYEMIDEGGGGCDSYYGLLTGSLTPKPAYYAVQSLIGAIDDGGSSSSPASLPLSLSTTTSTIHHLLLQKADGTYVLALWNEVQSWDVNNGTGVAVSPTPVSLTMQLASTPTSSSISTISDSGALQSGSLSWNAGAATLSLDDHVTLIKFAL
jgi:hypothetical protein